MADPQLGVGKRGRGPPKQKFLPPLNCPECLPKLLFPLRQFQGGVLFFFLETNRELGEK